MNAKKCFLAEVAKLKDIKGINDLMKYVEDETDFFTAPASVKYHGNYEGGLLDHSLNVLTMALKIAKDVEGFGEKEADVEMTSIILCSLFHDLCKTNFYVEEKEEPTKNQISYLEDLCKKAKTDMPKGKYFIKGYFGKCIDALIQNKKLPEYAPTYKVHDTLPMGHGEKSVFIISEFVALTDAEALAIRWHLGGFDPAINYGFPSGAPFKQACDEYPLVSLLVAADFSAAYLLDKTIK